MSNTLINSRDNDPWKRGTCSLSNRFSLQCIYQCFLYEKKIFFCKFINIGEKRENCCVHTNKKLGYLRVYDRGHDGNRCPRWNELLRSAAQPWKLVYDLFNFENNKECFQHCSYHKNIPEQHYVVVYEIQKLFAIVIERDQNDFPVFFIRPS